MLPLRASRRRQMSTHAIGVRIASPSSICSKILNSIWVTRKMELALCSTGTLPGGIIASVAKEKQSATIAGGNQHIIVMIVRERAKMLVTKPCHGKIVSVVLVACCGAPTASPLCGHQCIVGCVRSVRLLWSCLRLRTCW